MAYSTSNPPTLLEQRIGGKGAIWSYQSNDPAATVAGANYFTNGYALGMKVGDVVNVVDMDTGPATLTIHSVTAVTAGGAATVSAAI